MLIRTISAVGERSISSTAPDGDSSRGTDEITPTGKPMIYVLLEGRVTVGAGAVVDAPCVIETAPNETLDLRPMSVDVKYLRLELATASSSARGRTPHR